MGKEGEDGPEEVALGTMLEPLPPLVGEGEAVGARCDSCDMLNDTRAVCTDCTVYDGWETSEYCGSEEEAEDVTCHTSLESPGERMARLREVATPGTAGVPGDRGAVTEPGEKGAVAGAAVRVLGDAGKSSADEFVAEANEGPGFGEANIESMY